MVMFAMRIVAFLAFCTLVASAPASLHEGEANVDCDKCMSRYNQVKKAIEMEGFQRVLMGKVMATCARYTNNDTDLCREYWVAEFPVVNATLYRYSPEELCKFDMICPSSGGDKSHAFKQCMIDMQEFRNHYKDSVFEADWIYEQFLSCNERTGMGAQCNEETKVRFEYLAKAHSLFRAENICAVCAFNFFCSV